MAIIFTGTTITAVNHTTTDIDTVVHTGTTVFTSAPPNQIWVLAYDTSSFPLTDLGIIESSEVTGLWLAIISGTWPPNDYPVGTTGSVWDGDTIYYVYQIQEE